MDWIIVVILSRVLYFILVVKISLKTPESKTEIVLKRHWNSKESDVNEIFEVIDSRKLFTSILRGIIPPELSFLYIKATNKKKQFQIYAAINYIYASIEAIVYYPFFLIYVEYIHVDDFYGLNQYYQNATLLIAALAEGIIVFFSFVLLLIGLQIKYGRIFYCCE